MGSIAIKDAGHLIPDDALSTALKKYSKGSGLCLATDGNLEMQSSRSAYSSMAEALEEINKIQCPLKAETLVFYFTNYPDKLVATDEQPFILIADDVEVDGKKTKDPMLMCFIAGELADGFEPDASGHTREYLAVNAYLAVKMQRLYAQVGDDLEDFLKLLEDPLLKRELLGTLFDGTGDLVMIAASGEVMTFGVKSVERTFDWGWMSDSCGYGEMPDTGTLDQTIKDNAKGVLANIKSKGVLATVKAGITAATTHTPPKPDTVVDPEKVWVRPPQHIKQASNNKKKQWYEQRVAVVPLDWKNCPTILMDRVTAMKEGCQIVDAPSEKPMPDGVHAVPAKKGKDVEPHHVGPSSPIIPPKQQDYIVNEFLKSAAIVKTLDANSQAIANPAEDEETKYPTFCEKAGLPGLESVLRWDYAARMPLFRNAPEAANTLFGDLLRAYISQLSDKPKSATTTTKASVPAVKAPVAEVIPTVKRKRM